MTTKKVNIFLKCDSWLNSRINTRLFNRWFVKKYKSCKVTISNVSGSAIIVLDGYSVLIATAKELEKYFDVVSLTEDEELKIAKTRAEIEHLQQRLFKLKEKQRKIENEIRIKQLNI